jgi:transcriptional regulator with XRE-family HTH domain
VDVNETANYLGEMTAADFRRLRLYLDLTQEKMADALGISVSRLGEYERGRARGGGRSAAIPKTIELACEALRARFERQS